MTRTKSFNKLIAMVICIAMVLSLMAISASAASPTYFYVNMGGSWVGIPHGQDVVASVDTVTDPDEAIVTFGNGTYPGGIIGKVVYASYGVYTYSEGVDTSFNFPTNTNGYVILDQLVIYVSTDNGATWSPHSTLSNVKFNYSAQ